MCFNIFLKVIPLSLKQLLLFCLYFQFKYIYLFYNIVLISAIYHEYVCPLPLEPPSISSQSSRF